MRRVEVPVTERPRVGRLRCGDPRVGGFAVGAASLRAARMAWIVETAVPITSDRARARTRPAMVGWRRLHIQARSTVPVRRARIGSP